MRKAFPLLSLEFHGHNDLGMATANTIAALCSGADCASVTMNGLGERAGNAALEEVVMALELSCGVRTGLKTSLFGKLSEVVSLASDVSVGEQKPVVGRGVLNHETGIHTNLILKNRETYQIIGAARVGKKETEFVFGKHTGSAAVKELCLKYKIVLPEHMYDEITNVLKEMSLLLKRSLSSGEVLGIVGEAVEQLSSGKKKQLSIAARS
jgi:homocitrate synthase NifV